MNNSTLPRLDAQTGQLVNTQMGIYIPNVNVNPAFANIINPNSIGIFLINYIQSRMNEGPVRLGLFNQMSVNSYNNSDFYELLQYTIYVIELKIMNGLQPNPDVLTGISIECVSDYVGKLWLDIYQYVPPNLINQEQENALRILINRYQNNIELIKQRGQNNQPIYNNQVGYNPMIQNMVMQPNNHMRNVSNLAMSVMHNSNGFNNSQQPVINSRFSSTNNNSQPEVNKSHADVILENNKPPKYTDKWKPSEKYPYIYALNTNQTFVFEIEDNQTIKPIIIKDKGSNMDASKHFSPTVTITPTPHVEDINSNNRVKSLEEEVVFPTLNISEKSDKFIGDLSIDALSLTASLLLHTMKKSDNKINAFIAKGLLIDAIASPIDCTEFIESIELKENFSLAHHYLKMVKLQIDAKECKIADEISFNFMNKRLTDSVNEFIKKELALNYGYIDSFVEDAPELLSYYNDKVGKTYFDALNSNQSNIIKRACQVISKESSTKKAMDADYLSDIPEELSVSITYVQTPVTIMAVDIFSNELQFSEVKQETGKEFSIAVFPQITPLLYKLAKECVDYNIRNGEEDHKVYIKTLDNVLISVYKSILQPVRIEGSPVLIYVNK